MTDEIMFERVALIGIGLINSSIARLMKRDGLAGEIVIYSRRQSTLDKAMQLGLAERAESDAGAAVEDADVGSVKSAVIRDVAPHLPAGVHLVPAHPVAGTEHSGPEAGFAELFENHWCILTPPEGCDPAALEKIADLWRRAGSTVDIMDAVHHDKVLAITSHLPHLIAYNIVGTVADIELVTDREVVKYAAGGFSDFTRIAASDPEMWRDVFLNNQDAVLEMLGRFTEDLAALQRAIRWGDGEALEELFTRTRAIRRYLIEAKQV